MVISSSARYLDSSSSSFSSKTTIHDICLEKPLEDLCIFVDKHNSSPKKRVNGPQTRLLSDPPVTRRLDDPSSVEIDRIFRNGDSNLNTCFNGNIAIGNNTSSEHEYELFSEFLNKVLTFLYDKTPDFRAAIDSMNETRRDSMPGKPKFSGIIYNIDSSSRTASGSISAWKGSRGDGYRDSIRTDATPAEGAPFYMFLSLTKGLELNSDYDIETIFHEFAHALQFLSGNAAPFTDIYVRLSSRKSTGAFVNEFETTGGLKGPSPYTEISFLQSFTDREIETKPSYGGATTQEFITTWQKADPESYWDYENSTMPHGIKSFDPIFDDTNFTEHQTYGHSHPDANEKKHDESNQKAIVGGSVAGLTFVALLLLGYLCRRHCTANNRQSMPQQSNTNPPSLRDEQV